MAEYSNTESFLSKKLTNLVANLKNDEKNYSEFIDEVKKIPTPELNLEAQELIPKLCALLRPKTKRKLFNLCITTLMYLAGSCDPKILLLSLLANIHEKTKLKDVLFLNLLDPIFLCLKRIDFPKSNAISLAFNDLYKRIEYLELPKDYNLENKERYLLQFDTTTQTILKWLVPLHDRVEELLSCSLNKLQTKSLNVKEIVEFLKLEIKILSRPLAYFDLSYNLNISSIKTDSRSIAESCINNIHSIQPNSIKLLAWFAEQNLNSSKKTQENASSEKAFSDIGCSVYSYLVLGEKLLAPGFPYIFTANYLFQFNLQYILLLLQKSDSSLLAYKGLKLCSSLLQNLAPESWQADYLECENFIDFMKSLMYIAASTKSSELCNSAMQILATIVKVFKFNARSKIFHFLLLKAPREKVVGYVIALLKDEIVGNFDKKETLASALELEKLYQLVCSLPKGEKSDLLEFSEQVMGALNLIRFLVQLDPFSKNISHIWNVMPLIEEKYFKILGSAIELSRSHYKLEIKKILESRSEKKAAGIPLDDETQRLNDAQKIGFLEKAVHTFDMLEEILGKVSSIVQVEKNKVLKD